MQNHRTKRVTRPLTFALDITFQWKSWKY